MRLIPGLAAGTWMVAVGAQGLAHMAKYGIVPGLPAGLARVDFTPAYPALLGLVVLAAVLRRWEARA